MMAQLSIVAGLLVAFCCAAAADQPTGNAQRGEAVFNEYACYSCHGYHGVGRTPLDPESSGILSSEDLFIRYLRLRADQNPVNPNNSMPNYSVESLSNDKARDVYAYLVSLEHDPPAVDDIPEYMELLRYAEQDPPVDND